MSSRLLFAFVLAGALPSVASADECNGEQPKHVKVVTDSHKKDSSIIKADSYCFDLTFENSVVQDHASVKWDLVREEQPVLSLESKVSSEDGAQKASANKEKGEAQAKKNKALNEKEDARKDHDQLDLALGKIRTQQQKRALAASEFDQAIDIAAKIKSAASRMALAQTEIDAADQRIAEADAKIAALPPAATITTEKYPFTLEPGDKLVIKIWIDSQGTDGDPSQMFTYAVETGGHWQLGYGLLFMPGHDKEYFSRAVDDTFVVTRKSRRNAMTFAPGLIWSWYPTPTKNSFCLHGGFKCSFAAGIAADSSSPILFAGVQGTYHQNISLNFGVAVHQEKRLAGEYHEGQSLTESIDSDTLNKSVYRPNLYFGVSFRFDKSPF